MKSTAVKKFEKGKNNLVINTSQNLDKNMNDFIDQFGGHQLRRDNIASSAMNFVAQKRNSNRGRKSTRNISNIINQSYDQNLLSPMPQNFQNQGRDS